MAIKPKRGTAQSKRRIFVVEEHPVGCDGLVRLINTEQDLMVCGKASEAEYAFKDIRNLKPDLALIHLGVRAASGLDLIKHLRALKISLKLLVVSLHDEAVDAQRVLRAGGDGYILKTEDPSEIIHAIRDVLNGRIYVSEEVFAGGSSKSAAPQRASSLQTLTAAELQILASLGGGNSEEEMARHFRLTASQVEAHCRQLQEKLGLKSMNALIRYAVCWVEDIPNRAG